MLADFVKNVLAELHRRPVRELAQPWPFGRWLEATRQGARLSRENVALALEKDEDFVEQIETGEILPWNLSVSDAAKIVILFRVHMDVIKQLVHSSYVVSKAREALKKAKRPHRGERFEEKDPSVKLAVDLYYARNSEFIEMSEDVTKWLISLGEKLQSLKEGRILLK
jgi:transcriptional regulator with XRE-family HTH domain